MNDVDFSAIITAAIAGAVTVFNVLYTNRARRKKAKTQDEQNLENGVQCLLRAEIIRAHDKYTAHGFCPIYAKESLRRAYTAYHNLGGNDIATTLYNDCISLPEQPKEGNDDED